MGRSSMNRKANIEHSHSNNSFYSPDNNRSTYMMANTSPIYLMRKLSPDIFNKWNKLSYYNSEDPNIITSNNIKYNSPNIITSHNIKYNSPNIITYHNIKYNNHSKCIEPLALFNQSMDRILPSQHLIKQSNMKMN